jgi:hypothetical protein
MHVKPCPVCDKFDHKAIDCPELCPLCISTGDCNHIMAGPQWKGHPHYIIAQEDLPELDDLTSIDHPHFSLILLNKLAKDIEKEKEVQLENESAKVHARAQAERLNYQVDSVSRIPTHDPRDVINVDEEWFERRRKLNKGHQVWMF